MTSHPLRVTDYLRHILEAIERIREYTRNLTEQEFYSSQLVQDAVIRNFEIMGEAARYALLHGKDLADLQDNLSLFREVYWMRNVLTHGYFQVNLSIVWNAIQGDIGNLEQQVQDLYNRLVK
jgi:uncharacterized protein with HEPN domain